MKISFFTTCKNRLEHLQKTLPISLSDVRPGVEFVLLNYGSTDQLDDWAKRSLANAVNSGKLNYFRAAGILYYEPSHSKNCAAKLTTGDVICNLDADNYADGSFQDFIFGKFKDDPALDILFNLHTDGRTGRIAMRRKSFLALGGHDEGLRGYGTDDVDLRERASAMGMKCLVGAWERYDAIHNADKSGAYQVQDIYASDMANNRRMVQNLRARKLKANVGQRWGHIIAQKNWKEFVET